MPPLETEPGVFDNGHGCRFYDAPAAANFLGMGLRTFRSLKLTHERYGHNWRWREEVLEAHRAEHGPARGRGRRPSYDLWRDPDGNLHPFHKVNYYVTREILRRLGPEAVVPEWHEHQAFAYGVADVIGLQPSKRHRLETVEPGDMFGPTTVLWWREPRRPWLRGLSQRSRAGDEVAAAILARLATDDRASVHLRRLVAADQRLAPDEVPCYCTRILTCEYHQSLRRAGDDAGENEGEDEGEDEGGPA